MKTLFLDMDGVVADFDAYAEKVLGKHAPGEKWPSGDWAKLRHHKRMYRDLPKTKGADILVEFCRKFAEEHGLNLCFLTAVPKGNDMHWAFFDKVHWVQKYYPDIPVMFGPYSHDKHVHCTPDDILIDDRTSNCQEWTDAGGNAIQHRGDLYDTIHRLEAIGAAK
jgi:5'(3')-deoxyribonucleotidase